MFTVVGGKVEKKEIPATIMIFLFSRKEIELSQKGSLEVEKNAKFAVAAEVQFERETYLP